MAQTNKLRKLLTNNIAVIAQALVSLNVPGKVITDNLATGAIEVGEGNIVRLEIGADTYVAFSDESGTLPAVTASTTPAVKLVGAGVHYVVAQCDWIRASANPTRVELLEI